MRTKLNDFVCSKCIKKYLLKDITFECSQTGEYIADICPNCGHRED